MADKKISEFTEAVSLADADFFAVVVEGTPNENYKIQRQNTGLAKASDLSTHIGDTSNPHSVTAAQAGADPAGSAAAVQSSLDIHSGDATIHFTQASISITKDQISDADEGGLDYSIDALAFGFLPKGTPETTLAFDDGTYTLSLTPVGTDWSYYRSGSKFTISGAKTSQLSGSPPATGVYYFYIDADDGTISNSLTPWNLGPSETKVFVATVDWNNALTPKYRLYNERHLCDLTRGEHRYLHFTAGAQYSSGGVASGYTLQTATDAANTIGISAGVFYDETLRLDVPAVTDPDGSTLTYLCRYRNGTGGWVWALSAVPFLYASGSFIQYDDGDGTLATGSNGAFYNSWVLMTPAGYEIIQPQAEWASLGEAEAESFTDLVLTGLPVAEFIAVIKLTWRTNSSYASKGQVRMEAIEAIRVGAIPAVSGSVTASSVPVSFTPTYYTPASSDVEAHLVAIDGVFADAANFGSDSAADGYVLTADGAGGAAWEAVAGGGTVTSVAISGTDGIDVDSGSPITGAGTITLGINAGTLATHMGLGTAAYEDTTAFDAAGAAAGAVSTHESTYDHADIATALQPGDDAADLGSGAATDGYVLTADGAGGAAWEAVPGGGWDGDIADINLDGGTDIGADLADADLILVDDGANGTNRKSALSRVWTYIRSKLFPGESTVTGTSGSLSIDWSTSRYWKQGEPTGSITYTFTNPPAAQSHVQLRILSDGTSTAQTFTWPAAVKWVGATWTATANKNAVIAMFYDGTNYWAQGANEV